MLLSIFTPLYEVFIGSNPDNPEYRQGIFDSVGLLTLIIAVVICFLFYIALGNWKAIWYKLVHWFITIFICAFIGFIFAFTQAKSEIGSADGYVIRFAIFNAVFAAFYFVVFSFLFKIFSTFSKHTPV